MGSELSRQAKYAYRYRILSDIINGPQFLLFLILAEVAERLFPQTLQDGAPITTEYMCILVVVVFCGRLLYLFGKKAVKRMVYGKANDL